jgi:peptidoglycan DL-endopeptidase CwlO
MRILAAAVASTWLLTTACAPKAAGIRIGHPALGTATGARASSSDDRLRLFDDPLPADDAEQKERRLRVAAAASKAVGRRSLVVGGVRYRMDCSGVARGIYASAGAPLGEVAVDAQGAVNDTRMLFELVERRGSLRRARPLPGDLVFFDDTYDQDGDGRRDDPLSHVGVVEGVDDDGTVRFVHKVAGGIVRYRMNLDRPHDRKDAATGKTLNHYLRRAEGGQPAKTTAELFVAYGSLDLDDDAPLVAWR